VASESRYDRLNAEWLSERNRTARDARYRANVACAVHQVRLLVTLGLTVGAVLAGVPVLVDSVADVLARNDHQQPMSVAPAQRDAAR
jgi:hypothetical protein